MAERLSIVKLNSVRDTPCFELLMRIQPHSLVILSVVNTNDIFGMWSVAHDL